MPEQNNRNGSVSKLPPLQQRIAEVKLAARFREVIAELFGDSEAYRRLGLAREGVALSCRPDGPFAEALVPGIRLDQSRTLFEGNHECLFDYRMGES